MYKVKDYITIDKEILGGNPVFKGTRVPVESLFLHLENGIPLDEFLLDFPSVTKNQAIAVIEIAKLTSEQKKAIDQARDEINRGEGVSSEQVDKEFDEWLSE